MHRMSTITTTPAAAPADAARHFAARLALETDAADVGAAVVAGDLDGVVILDVRSAEAYAAGHVAGALHLHHSGIDADTAAALPDGLVVVYCWGPGCNGAQRGGLRLAQHGREVKEMLGGFEYYEREGWPVEVAEEAAAAPGTVGA